MDEKDLNHAMEQINVPKEKVFSAMDKGMKKASEMQIKSSAKKKITFSTVATVALLGITITSGFINPSMNKVLAKAPFIGQIYQEFGDSMGTDLAQRNLVTDLNQSLTRNGVTVKLTSAYYDGNVVSITGHVDGDIDQGGNEKGEVSFDVNFENNKGDNDPWLNGMAMGMKKKENGYDFHWKLAYPYKTIKENYTLPVSIHYINGSKGEWNFDIPIMQKKYNTLSFEKLLKSYPNVGIQVGVKEMLVAQASSSLEFETVSKYKDDQIDLYKAIDNKGNILFQYRNNSTLSESKEQDGYHKTLRKTFDKIDSNITSITFYPQVSIADPVVEQLLNTKIFTLKSTRTNMAIKVNNVRQEGDKLIVDYNFLGLPEKMSKHKFEILTHNLGYEFSLVDQDYLDQIDPENPVPPKNHSVSRNKVTLLDEKTAHFQSVFNLKDDEKIENFKLQNTVVRFNFSSFIGTEELAPFTVDLTNGK